MRNFFALKNVKLPSIEKIRMAEKELMIPYEMTETRAIRFPMRQVFESHCKESIEIRTELMQEQLPLKLFEEAYVA